MGWVRSTLPVTSQGYRDLIAIRETQDRTQLNPGYQLQEVVAPLQLGEAPYHSDRLTVIQDGGIQRKGHVAPG